MLVLVDNLSSWAVSCKEDISFLIGIELGCFVQECKNRMHFVASDEAAADLLLDRNVVSELNRLAAL